MTRLIQPCGTSDGYRAVWNARPPEIAPTMDRGNEEVTSRDRVPPGELSSGSARGDDGVRQADACVGPRREAKDAVERPPALSRSVQATPRALDVLPNPVSQIPQRVPPRMRTPAPPRAATSSRRHFDDQTGTQRTLREDLLGRPRVARWVRPASASHFSASFSIQRDPEAPRGLRRTHAFRRRPGACNQRNACAGTVGSRHPSTEWRERR
jgi:hypothetical protein